MRRYLIVLVCTAVGCWQGHGVHWLNLKCPHRVMFWVHTPHPVVLFGEAFASLGGGASLAGAAHLPRSSAPGSCSQLPSLPWCEPSPHHSLNWAAPPWLHTATAWNPQKPWAKVKLPSIKLLLWGAMVPVTQRLLTLGEREPCSMESGNLN